MHRFTIGFGGTKSDLFNRARNTLNEMSPIKGRINGNTESGRIFVPGQVPMSDEMLIIDYMVGNGLIDFVIRTPLPNFLADNIKSQAEELVPKGDYQPDGNVVLPASIPIEKMPDLSKTIGRKQKQESKQLSVIEDDKPMLPKKVMTTLAIITAIGFGMYFFMDEKKPAVRDAA